MPEESVLEVKIKFIEDELKDIKKILNTLSKDEKDRMEKYSDSNAKLCYLQKEVEELKEQVDNRPNKVISFVSIGITIILFLYVVIENIVRATS